MMVKSTKDFYQIFKHKDHIGCSFWESHKGTIIVVTNPNVADLVAQSELVLEHGYALSGGIQLIRRDNGEFNAAATFVKADTIARPVCTDPHIQAGKRIWKSPEKKIIVISNTKIAELLREAEFILEYANCYWLYGGINLIRRDDGTYNGTATFLMTNPPAK